MVLELPLVFELVTELLLVYFSYIEVILHEIGIEAFNTYQWYQDWISTGYTMKVRQLKLY